MALVAADVSEQLNPCALVLPVLFPSSSGCSERCLGLGSPLPHVQGQARYNMNTISPVPRGAPTPAPPAAPWLSLPAIPLFVVLVFAVFILWRLNVFCSSGVCVAPATPLPASCAVSSSPCDSLKPFLSLCLLESPCPLSAALLSPSRHRRLLPVPPLLMPPSSFPSHCSCPCPALPAGFYKNKTILLVFIYKHSFIGLLPSGIFCWCFLLFVFPQSPVLSSRLSLRRRSQQDRGTLCLGPFSS